MKQKLLDELMEVSEEVQCVRIAVLLIFRNTGTIM